MKLVSYLKCLFKNTKERKLVQDITDTLPSNEIIAKEILSTISNDSTKIILDEDIKNSYYIYFQDTIYLSHRKNNQQRYTRILLIAHECIHSMQSKKMQKANFILSNIELVSFVTIAILSIFFPFWYLLYLYLAIAVITIIPRIILEGGAITQSVELAKKYLELHLEKQKTQLLINVYQTQLLLLSPIYIISLLLARMIRSIMIYFILVLKRKLS